MKGGTSVVGNITYLVIVISSISVICVCILIVARCLWIRRQKLIVEQISVAQRNDNEKHNNMQHNVNVSHESNDSMYMEGHGNVDDHGTTTTKVDNDLKECDNKRKEGEPAFVCEVDDTDVGDV